jgi:STE24 endopeptidase
MMRSQPGLAFLLAMAVLATLILLLGYVPWSKVGTVWRPTRIEESNAALRHWDATIVTKGREFRSNGYTRYFRRKGIVGLFLVAVLAFGLNLWLRRVPPGPGLIGATLAVLLVFVMLDLIALPFGLSALADAREYGISKQSVGFWLSDRYKGLLITLVISAIVVAVLLYLIQRFPRSWPWPAATLAAIGTMVMVLIVPLVIDPVFNKFTPLGDTPLRERFLDIARRGGIPVREVLVSDASRRTTAVNAYFTGLGPTKRIVVYDTLIESLQPDEAGLVVAHEAGHWSRGHIVKGIVLAVAGMTVGLLLLRLFLDGVFRHKVFGIEGPFDPAAAPLLLLLYWFATFASLPIENFISRAMEREADKFALDLTGDAAAQIKTEVALGTKNLGDIIPPPLVEALLYTHPAPLDRVAQAERFLAASRTPRVQGEAP